MPAITAVVAAALAVVLIALSARVILHRRGKLIGIGDGGDKELQRKIRAHANFIEYVPLALLMLALAELGGAHRLLVAGIGVWLVAARIAHAAGLSRKPGHSHGRFFGTASTMTILLILAIVDVIVAIPRL
jgi:uncharacterized membrane protein YecN with MAPEG domain